jgi:hypothetical protein
LPATIGIRTTAGPLSTAILYAQPQVSEFKPSIPEFNEEEEEEVGLRGEDRYVIVKHNGCFYCYVHQKF